jgi:hypothetical protein
LLAALSLAWPYIAGLGGLPALVLPAQARRQDAADLRLLAAVWSFGLCLDYALLLLLGWLPVALGVGAGLALALGLAAVWRWRHRLGRPRSWRPWLIAAALLLLGTAVILLDPLDDWDARSIWFFHGKMIFFGGGLTEATGLGLRLGYGDHSEYPMLVPALAGETAFVVGFWNEYLPKLALALLLPVPILAALGLRDTPRSMAIAIFAFVAVPEVYLSNGSMDGYLAIYAGAAALFLADWLEGRGDAALLAAAGALGVVGGLKLEGQVVYIALGLSFILLAALGRLKLPRPRIGALLLAPLPLAGYVIWQVLQRRWGLPGEGFSVIHAWPRLGDPLALWQIARGVLLDERVVASMLILVSVAGLLRRRGKRFSSTAWLALLAGFIYLLILCAAFAMRQADLTWQLDTAASRVARSGAVLLLISAVVALRALERTQWPRDGASDRLQLGAAGKLLEMRAAELCIGEGMGHPRVLLGLLDKPAAVARACQDTEEALIVDNAVAGRGEQPLQHRLREADVATPAGRQRVTPDILAVDVDDALGVAPGDLQRIAAGKRHMTRIEQQADRGAAILQQPVDVLCRLDHGPHVVVHGHAHAAVEHMVGDGGEALAELLPLRRGGEARPGRGRRPDIVDDLARRLGEDHDRRTQRLQEVEMLAHGGDLGLGVAGQQLRAVPAGDQRQALRLEQGPELPGVAREFAPELDAAEAGKADLGQALLERDEVAQPMHAVIGPADRVDAKLHGHVGSPRDWSGGKALSPAGRAHHQRTARPKV